MNARAGGAAPSDAEPRFAVAVALTSPYLAMAAGLLARLRALHPACDVFVYTDRASRADADRLAARVGAANVACPAPLDYDCGEWGGIVQAKFHVMGRNYGAPIVFLDVDQVLYRRLSPFVAEFIGSGAAIAGSPDDEGLPEQFQDGCAPPGACAGMPAINSGAFMVRPDPGLHRLVTDALPRFAGRARLPTQAVINGVIHAEGVTLHRFGDDFMAGPFSPRVLERPRRCALIHFWTPRPPFMHPNAARSGERSYQSLTREFQRVWGVPYLEAELERDYRSQMALAGLADGVGACPS